MGLVHLHQVLAVDVVVLEQIDILGAVDTLQPVANLVLVPMSAHVSGVGESQSARRAHLMASGASYISENSDSVGEANIDCSARVFDAWLR